MNGRAALSGRVAIVAGASGGIGSATVRAMLARGMSVVLAAQPDALLDELARELEPMGSQVLVVPTDITRRADVDLLVARTLVAYGRIDALANVAGIGSRPSFCDSTDDELERVLAVNVLGAARLMHAVLPVMKAQRSGAIVNVGSVAGEAAVMGIYSGSKFGLRGLNDSVRREVRSFGIGVTLIQPGFVRTPMNPAMNNLPGPEIVAEAIVAAISRPRRSVIVPRGYMVPVFLVKSFPALTDVVFGDARVQARLNRDARALTNERGAIVVTGASSGIGADTAALLAREGFAVFAGVRSDADAAAVEALHPNVYALRLDVTDRASITAAAAAVAANGVPLRGLVNNAGIAVGGPLEFLPVEDVRRQFEINVFGTLEVTQAFLPQLREQRGRIVFVGSISGRLAVPFVGPYSASKFALRAVSDALRMELAPFGVKVVLVEPGSVKTPIWAKGRAAKDALLARLPQVALKHYGAALDRLFAGTEAEERSGMPVERVSAAILHALTSPSPAPSVVLGAAARAGSILATLPAKLRDRALRASMKLP